MPVELLVFLTAGLGLLIVTPVYLYLRLEQSKSKIVEYQKKERLFVMLIERQAAEIEKLRNLPKLKLEVSQVFDRY